MLVTLNSFQCSRTPTWERGKGLFLWPLGFTAAVSFLPRRKVSRHTWFFFSYYKLIKLLERTSVHLIQTPIFRWEEHDLGKLMTCLETHGLLEAGARIHVMCSPGPSIPHHSSRTEERKNKFLILQGLPSDVLAEEAEGVSRELKRSRWWFWGKNSTFQASFPPSLKRRKARPRGISASMGTNHVSIFMFHVKLEGTGPLVIPTLIVLGLWIWRDRYRHSHLSQMVLACQTSLWSAGAHYLSWPIPLSLAEMASPLLGHPTPQAWAVLWTAGLRWTEGALRRSRWAILVIFTGWGISPIFYWETCVQESIDPARRVSFRDGDAFWWHAHLYRGTKAHAPFRSYSPVCL